MIARAQGLSTSPLSDNERRAKRPRQRRGDLATGSGRTATPGQPAGDDRQHDADAEEAGEMVRADIDRVEPHHEGEHGHRLEAAGRFEDPRYMELLLPSYYTQHILRMPPDQWPDGVNRAFARLNRDIYVPMQGPSEMGAGGVLATWDRFADLKTIAVPTMVIGARYDTMDPAYLENMAKQLPKGRYLFCRNGSHLAMYDDQQTYMNGIIAFLHDVDTGKL